MHRLFALLFWILSCAALAYSQVTSAELESDKGFGNIAIDVLEVSSPTFTFPQGYTGDKDDVAIIGDGLAPVIVSGLGGSDVSVEPNEKALFHKSNGTWYGRTLSGAGGGSANTAGNGMTLNGSVMELGGASPAGAPLTRDTFFDGVGGLYSFRVLNVDGFSATANDAMTFETSQTYAVDADGDINLNAVGDGRLIVQNGKITIRSDTNDVSLQGNNVTTVGVLTGGTSELRLRTRNIAAGFTNVGQYLRLSNVNGQVEFDDLPSSVTQNFARDDLSLTANRTHTQGSFDYKQDIGTGRWDITRGGTNIFTRGTFSTQVRNDDNGARLSLLDSGDEAQLTTDSGTVRVGTTTPVGKVEIATPNVVTGGASVGQFLALSAASGEVEYVDAPTDNSLIGDNAFSNYMDIGEMRIQWGRVTATSTIESVTYPAVFDGVAGSFTATSTTNTSNYVNENTLAQTSAGTQVSGYDINGNSAVVNFSWMAIGTKPPTAVIP